MTVIGFSGSDERNGRDVLRWSTCVAVVLAAHGLAVALLLAARAPIAPITPVPAAIMIDLAPAPAVEPPKPRPPEPQPHTVPEPPRPTPAPHPAVVLPPPKSRVVHHAPPPTVEPPPTPAVEPPPQIATAPNAPPAPAAVVPPAPSVSPRYEGLVMAQLARNKRYPTDARMRHQEGVATLRFTIGRDGRLLGFKLEAGSGHASLDREVLAMVERAAPFPAFPPEMPQAQLELVMPVRFSLR